MSNQLEPEPDHFNFRSNYFFRFLKSSFKNRISKIPRSQWGCVTCELQLKTLPFKLQISRNHMTKNNDKGIVHLLLLPKKLKPVLVVLVFGIIRFPLYNYVKKCLKVLIFKTITWYLIIVYVVFDSIWPNLTTNNRKNDQNMVKAGSIWLLSISRCLTWIPNLIYGNFWSESITFNSKMTIVEQKVQKFIASDPPRCHGLIDCFQNKGKIFKFCVKIAFFGLKFLTFWQFDAPTDVQTIILNV